MVCRYPGQISQWHKKVVLVVNQIDLRSEAELAEVGHATSEGSVQAGWGSHQTFVLRGAAGDGVRADPCAYLAGGGREGECGR